MKRLIWLVILVYLAAFIPLASAERLEDDTLMTFYDDTIFFGDSRMESLRRYILSIRETDEEFMKKTKLICVGGIGLYAASRNYLSGAFLFSYAGVELTMFEAAEKFHPKRVFILLGLNDEVGVKVDKAITWVEDILRRMEEMAPGTEVYFFSETPVTEKYEIKENLKDYQKALDRYNAVYAVIPPVTALLGSRTSEEKVVAFPELGMEALHLIKVDRYPAIIGAAHGRSIYEK